MCGKKSNGRYYRGKCQYIRIHAKLKCFGHAHRMKGQVTNWGGELLATYEC